VAVPPAQQPEAAIRPALFVNSRTEAEPSPGAVARLRGALGFLVAHLKNSSRRRALIIAGLAGGALLLFVVAGVVFYPGLSGRTNSHTSPLEDPEAGVFQADPAGGSSELPSPGYLELASLLVNEHYPEWQAAMNRAPASPPPLNFNEKLSPKDEMMRFVNRAFIGSAGSPNYVPIVQSDKLFPVMDRLGKTRNPVIRLALDKLKEGQRQDADKEVDAHVEAMKKQIDIVAENARRGEYIRTITEEVQRENLDGRFVPESVQRTVNEGEAAIAEATRAAREAEESAPEYKNRERWRLLEEARVEAWKAMEPRLAEVYPPNSPSADLVQIQINRLQFAAVNTGGRVLTNVTLLVQVYHFLTAPDESDYRVYFIPRWEAGQPIYLSTTLWRDDKEPVKGRPPFTFPGNSGDHWLNGLGGVIKVRSVAWAAEANQPEEITSFPAHAEEGARWETKIASDSVTAKVRDWQESQRVKRFIIPSDRTPQAVREAWAQDKFTLPADAFELQAARRVLSYAAADSEPARQAKRLLEHPEAFGSEKNNEVLDQFAKLTEPGARFEGEWKIWLNPGYKAPQAAQDNKDNHGRIVLRIESRDMEARTITATLQDAGHPELQRALKGGFIVDYTGKVGMNFLTPKPEQPKPGTRLTAQERDALRNPPEYWDLLRTPQNFHIWPEGGALQCRTAGDSFWYHYEATLRPSGG
jgi:hypothetical protein